MKLKEDFIERFIDFVDTKVSLTEQFKNKLPYSLDATKYFLFGQHAFPYFSQVINVDTEVREVKYHYLDSFLKAKNSVSKFNHGNLLIGMIREWQGRPASVLVQLTNNCGADDELDTDNCYQFLRVWNDNLLSETWRLIEVHTFNSHQKTVEPKPKNRQDDDMPNVHEQILVRAVVEAVKQIKVEDVDFTDDDVLELTSEILDSRFTVDTEKIMRWLCSTRYYKFYG